LRDGHPVAPEASDAPDERAITFTADTDLALDVTDSRVSPHPWLAVPASPPSRSAAEVALQNRELNMQAGIGQTGSQQ
jgi:hypothetical protein